MQLELPFDEIAPERLAVLRERVREHTRELLALARSRWPAAELPHVEIRFRMRGHSAGEACSTTGVANYNLDLLKRYGDDFIRRIVPHEVAHIVAERVYGSRIRPHGPEWRSVMKFFGAEPRVTHDYPTTPARRTRRYRYRCRCPDPHWLTGRAHRRIRRGTAEYSCRKCRSVLARVE